ncbi:MAG: hypothetical protein CW338_02960 [Clostridiales bacterium]|nr:hypothetical protein [Clostridiales bacterium]
MKWSPRPPAARIRRFPRSPQTPPRGRNSRGLFMRCFLSASSSAFPGARPGPGARVEKAGEL